MDFFGCELRRKLANCDSHRRPTPSSGTFVYPVPVDSIELVDSVKLLGVLLHECLRFDEHVRYYCHLCLVFFDFCVDALFFYHFIIILRMYDFTCEQTSQSVSQ